MSEKQSHTGASRARKTKRSVLLMDRVSGAVITLGGFGTILAVLFVCAFLISVVIPLFRDSELDRGSVLELEDSSALAALD